jgi:hypothetical protein
VKLTSLFAQYLYTNHRLELPGIGIFVLDPSTIASIDNSKQRSIVLNGVSFEYNTSVKESPELIAFISSQSGKMKALASADLESFVQQAQQFLNIGKPFELEGIGILVKKQKGEFVFTPLTVPTEKLKEHKSKEPAPVTLEESSAQYESFLGSPKVNTGWRKPVIALLIIAGAGLAIWGGYTISRKAATADVTEVVDTTHVITPTDTVVAVSPEPVKPKDYKYILQVSKRNTALRRYKQLRENLWDVGMETKDSVDYKLFLLLPMRTDTTHVVDSLTSLTGKKVYIEYQN